MPRFRVDGILLGGNASLPAMPLGSRPLTNSNNLHSALVFAVGKSAGAGQARHGNNPARTARFAQIRNCCRRTSMLYTHYSSYILAMEEKPGA